MPNWLTNISAKIGTAVGAFDQARYDSRRNRQIPFLDSMTAEHKWKGGEYNRNAQRRALLNSWIFSAIRFIASETITAELEVVRRVENVEDVTSIPNHPLETILRRPNPYMGKAFLMMYTVYWMKLNGNGYWYVACNRYGKPAELWPLPAWDVDPMPGNAQRFIDYYEYTSNGRTYQLPAEKVVHLRNLPNPFDPFRGMSELIAAMLPADADSSMARWNGAFFGRNNALPSTIINLRPPDGMLPDQSEVEALKHDLRTEYSSFKRKTLVTTAYDITVNDMGLSAKDMDFLSGRQFTKEEIYSIYGIPAGLDAKDATRANSTQADIVFKGKVIWPFLTLIAEDVTAQLVIPYYGSDLEARFKDLRPEDRELAMQEIDRAGNYLTIDEIRMTYYNREPLPDGRGELTAAEATTARNALTLMPPEEEPESQETEEEKIANELTPEARDDVKKWQRKALNALRKGQPANVLFESTTIPDGVRTWLQWELGGVIETEEVKAVFAAVLNGDGIREGPSASRPFASISGGKATGNDDPQRWYKQRQMNALQTALLDYFSGLHKRVLTAVEEGRTDEILQPFDENYTPDFSGTRL